MERQGVGVHGGNGLGLGFSPGEEAESRGREEREEQGARGAYPRAARGAWRRGSRAGRHGDGSGTGGTVKRRRRELTGRAPLLDI